MTSPTVTRPCYATKPGATRSFGVGASGLSRDRRLDYTSVVPVNSTVSPPSQDDQIDADAVGFLFKLVEDEPEIVGGAAAIAG